MRSIDNVPSEKQTSQVLQSEALIAVDGLSAAYEAQDDKSSAQSPRQLGRWILLGLVVLNVVLWFLYTQTRSVWGQSSEAGIQTNIAETKIALNAADEIKTLPLTSVLIATPAPLPTPQANNPIATPATSIAAVEQTRCMVWSFTNNAEVKRADSRLTEQAWSGYASELADEPPTYMAFIGPLPSQQQTDALVKTLVKLKINNYSVLPSGSIALGVVATREAGKQLQQQLKNRGLKDVQLTERQGKNKLNRYRFEKMTPTSFAALRQLSQGLGVLSECVKP